MNRMCCGMALGVVAVVGAARADLITADPYLYGVGRMYHQTSAPMHFESAVGFFDVFVDFEMLGGPIGPPPPGTTHVDPVAGVAAMKISLNGLPPGEPWTPPIGMMIQTGGVGPGTFNTEMLAMTLSKVDVPGPPARSVRGRESPSIASLGQTHISDAGGGLFRINSFFDVFVELSFDDGQSWVPSTNGPAHFELVPAPGAAAVLGLGGLMAGRRRRRV